MLGVTASLEHRFGLRRAALSQIGPALRAALTGPKEVSHKARLVILIDPPSADYVSTSVTEREGLVVALGPIFDRVDRYLAFDTQAMLPLTPDIVSSKANTG